MLVLFLHAGGERYALDALVVEELVPAVPLRPVPGTMEPVLGLLDFRGHVVPVVDLCRLLGHGPCPERLHSRIAVLDLVRAGVARPAEPPWRHRLGLLAEEVVEVGRLDPEAPGAHPGPRPEGRRILGRVLRHGGDLVQLVAVGDLVPPAVLDAVHARDEEPAA